MYFLGRAILRPLVWILYRPVITGRNNVPASGPVLFASNHQSGWDTLLLPTVSPRPVQFLTKSELFTGTGLFGRMSKWFFTSIGGVPVVRTSGRDSRSALETGRKILQSGSAVGIFPEGTRSRDGKLHRGHTGAAWMALEAQAPIIPVGLVGSDHMVPFRHLFSRKHRLEIHFSEAVYPESVGDLPGGKARSALTETVMTKIAALSQRERV